MSSLASIHLISTRLLILQRLVGELAEIIRLMAKSAPVETVHTVHLNYPSNCIHGWTYTIGEKDLSLRLLWEWVV